MWVVNQDNLAIVQVEALALDPAEFNKENNKNGYRIWGSAGEHDFVMGVYKTLEEATDVLIDFAAHVKEQSNAPYVMPKSKTDKDVA